MTSLLSTKLGPQARGVHAVRRPRLREVLEASTEARLVLIAAPAGFGKSTLLADWLATTDAAWGWVSLDAGDNDPVRFWRYLLAAAASIAGDAPSPGSGASTPEGEAAVTALLDRMGACPRPCVLVLDDYHLIEERSVHEQMAFALARLPPGARIAIATRSDPPFPVARIRAAGELLEIRAADLRFTAVEVSEWLCGAMGIPLSSDEVALLAARTEGWAAAIQLAALTLRGRMDAGELVRRLGASHRFVFDYVVEEVIAGLAPSEQEFLLRTSIADRLCGPLCDALTGEPGGQAQLEAFEEANLLISSLDDDRTWFRYHALFAEILRARLRVAHPELDAELHERASGWFEDHGDVDEAIRHGLQASDLEGVRRLLRGNWLERLKVGEIRTVRDWLDALPDTLVRSDPQLSNAYGWSLILGGDYAGVPRRIADAEAALATSDDPFDHAVLPQQMASQRAKLAEMEGDLDGSLQYARVALDLIPADIEPTYGTLMRGQATIQLAHVLRKTGDLAGAAATYRAAIPLFAAGGNWLAVARSVCNVARFEISAGNAGAALELCRATLPQFPASSSAVAAVRVAMAEAHLANGDPDEAEAELTEAIDLARRGGDGPTLAEAAAVGEHIGQARSGGSTDRGTRKADGSRAGSELVEPLTPRELEVLHLVCAGRSNSQIATELFVTVGTAKAHIHTIYGKLGAANRVEAVLRAREMGLSS